MLIRINKITSGLLANLGAGKRQTLSNKKMVEHLDWRPEAQARKTRSRKLSKLSR